MQVLTSGEITRVNCVHVSERLQVQSSVAELYHVQSVSLYIFTVTHDHWTVNALTCSIPSRVLGDFFLGLYRESKAIPVTWTGHKG